MEERKKKKQVVTIDDESNFYIDNFFLSLSLTGSDRLYPNLSVVAFARSCRRRWPSWHWHWHNLRHEHDEAGVSWAGGAGRTRFRVAVKIVFNPSWLLLLLLMLFASVKRFPLKLSIFPFPALMDPSHVRQSRPTTIRQTWKQKFVCILINFHSFF